MPPVFGESDDPERLVPIVTSPDKFLIAVAGDPNRTNAYAMSHDGPHGDWTAARIDRTGLRRPRLPHRRPHLRLTERRISGSCDGCRPLVNVCTSNLGWP